MVIRSAYWLPRILLTCPAQVHFRLLTCSITSMTFVFSLTQKFVFLSRYKTLEHMTCAPGSIDRDEKTTCEGIDLVGL